MAEKETAKAKSAEKSAEAPAEGKPEAAKDRKRKDRKSVPVGVAHIDASFNNTIITFTDATGNTIAWGSCGGAAFKGSRKSTPFAAQVAAELASKKAIENGMRSVSIL